MKAIRKLSPEPGLTLTDIPPPRPGPGEVLIQVEAAGICGTDAHIYIWDGWSQARIRPPLTLGHEFVGRIVDRGKSVTHVEVGARVSAEGHLSCGVCFHCHTGQAHICPHMKILGVDTEGAFAEFVSVPATNVWPIDDSIPLEHAAIHDPLGNAMQTAMAVPVAGKTVLIEGCGPIGCLCAAITRASGAARVLAVDLQPYRLELARTMGAHESLHATDDDVLGRVEEVTDGRGVDVVLEVSGAAPAIQQGLRAVRNGGEVVLLGIPKNPVQIDIAEDVVFKGISLRGIVGRKMYETWYQVRAFLRSGHLDPSPLITHVLPFAEFETGIRAILDGAAGKVVLRLPAAATTA